MIRVHATEGTKVGREIIKSPWATVGENCLIIDPTVVSFDSIPACDGRMDGDVAYVCVALWHS